MGYAVAGHCVALPQVASVACSSISGSTSEGSVSCSAPSFDDDYGAMFYTRVLDTASGQTSRDATLYLTHCDEMVGVDFPLNLSAEDGALLAFAIVGVWSAAWAMRQLVRVLDNNDGASES